MDIAAERDFNSLKVGDTEQFEVEMTGKTVSDFAEFSGDYNPLHVNPEYAVKTEFGRPVAHGMIVGSLFSRLVGMRLPGKFCLYVSQSLEFHKAIFPGDKILIEGVIEQKVDALKIIKVKTSAYLLPDRSLCVSGYALVKLLQ